MKVIGEMIYSMEQEKKLGLMVAIIKVIIKMEKSKVWEDTLGMMDLNTLVSGVSIKYVGLVYIHGWTIESMRANGLITIWKE